MRQIKLFTIANVFEVAIQIEEFATEQNNVNSPTAAVFLNPLEMAL